MTKGILIKIFPIVGSLILFLSWVFQQSLLGDANSALQRIYTAQSVFQTYQSNNALFNAIIEVVKNDSESVEKIRRSQIYNYELGLKELEALLDEEERNNIPRPPNPFSGTSDIDTMTQITQARINQIQGKLAAKRDEIANRKSTLNSVFLALYAIGSVTVLTGAALNAITSAKSSEAKTRSDKP
jgi:hypothetical protein